MPTALRRPSAKPRVRTDVSQASGAGRPPIPSRKSLDVSQPEPLDPYLSHDRRHDKPPFPPQSHRTIRSKHRPTDLPHLRRHHHRPPRPLNDRPSPPPDTSYQPPHRPRDRPRMRRARRHAPPPPPTPRSSTDDTSADDSSLNKHHEYDIALDTHWRLPILRSPRKLRLRLSEDRSRPDDKASRHTPWSHPTPDPSRPSADRPPTPVPAASSNAAAVAAATIRSVRSDRRSAPPPSWRDDLPPSTTRDRAAKRLVNSGARWRGLLARKDLVDGKADAYCTESNEDITPRSSLDIEEATSLYSLEIEPPSTSVRGWRSNHSLSYRPRPNDRPRHIRVIGRQCCINDLSHIVDASNEPCVSYDRQIFDPASKLWTYVEACAPSSSRWELVSYSPLTCSVSGTEEPGSTIRGTSLPPTTSRFSSTERAPIAASPQPLTIRALPPIPPIPPKPVKNVQVIQNVEEIDLPSQVTSTNSPEDNSPKVDIDQTQPIPDVLPDEDDNVSFPEREDDFSPQRRRNSSPPIAALTDEEVARRVFMKAREQWLGYSRKSVYGPANLEAVIFASEMDDAEEGVRRASMV